MLTTVSVGMVATPAQAAAQGAVKVTHGYRVTYHARWGQENKVVVTGSGTSVTIDDRVAIIPGKGCKQVGGDKTKVRCRTPSEARVWIQTYDRNDSVVNRSGLPTSIDGGSGRDLLVGGPRRDIIDGDTGADRIYGNAGDDKLDGYLGDDRIWGGDGGDSLIGSYGDDVISGGDGGDTFTSGDGNDREYGGPGNDLFLAGPPLVTGAADADIYLGGSGRDAVSFGAQNRPVTADADGVQGDDGVRGEHDTIGADIEEIQGGYGNDRLYGTERADNLYGAEGDDVIIGNGGADFMVGDAGRDSLYGGAGNDRLDGYEYRTAAADRLDGGANDDAAGDQCLAYGGDVKVACES
ncbi:Ca2+-binding RTX toxin-like protein [Actinoplanes campanulatus]|uniref:Ca2+-binding RTX toxin-like protein n=1 Tax=Actinoplanes campanulatus TaxID=113559 RepID=A0A7W5AQ90_9ACTN|nr:calcium-binding protein [Actinoplanes campanulatus]MBB3100393.1 Ca2+-binding RTX toxin-like protein [Actinoplanes campanulatus]